MIKIKTLRLVCLICLGMLGGFSWSQTIRLQIGAAVPVNSPWDIGMRQLASEWARISGNRVQIQFPRSAANISQNEIIQRLSFQLNGALLENSGINLLDQDMFYLAMPAVIQNEQEFAAAIEAAAPAMAAKLSDRYVLLGIAQGGWVYFFSNRSIATPADLVGIRIGVNPDHEILLQQLQILGARPVKATSTSFILQFNSNQIDVVYTSPLLISTMWSQLRRSVSHMSAIKLGPFFGALVINKNDWERIPADLRPLLQAAATKAINDIATQSLKLEAEAIAKLETQGLTVTRISAANQRLWNEQFIGTQQASITQGTFSAGFMEAVNNAIRKVRD